ncbi:type II secretion system F family protein [Longispora sp. K20-0274]|uniref:type II secretion system F family protein n=1 Tax=Longispora sp. K20-0274 TaxID=3088255 RepID=UPI003999F398
MRRRSSPRGRLRRLGLPGAGDPPLPVAARALAGLAAGAGTALLVGGWPGLALGVPVGVAAGRAVAALEPAARRRIRVRVLADAPFAADLLSAVLRSGAAPSGAAGAVGAVLGGPLGDRLTRVAADLRAGRAPADAWAPLADTPPGARIAAAAVRSSESGGAFAVGLERLALELRAEQNAAATAAVHRVGVFIVLPLGLCFLPAFVLAGLGPVVFTIFGQFLR